MEAAASVIAFVQISTEIVKCMVKTKQIWEQAQDLPEDARYLVDRLQYYKPIFENIQKQLFCDDFASTMQNDSLVLNSLDFCQKAHEKLEGIANDLHQQLSTKKGLKRRLSAVRVVIGRDKLELFKERLSDSIELLKLSVMAWDMAVSRRAPDVIVKRLTRELSASAGSIQSKTLPAVEADKDEDHRHSNPQAASKQLVPAAAKTRHSSRSYSPSRLGRFALAYTNGTGAWQAYVQWPSWLSQSVYEFQSSPTICGWTYNYRVYNIVARDSEIIKRVQRGDKDGVLELFSSRQASPFDKDDSGESLLYYAAHSKHYDICYLLLQMGLQNSLTERSANDIASGPLAELVFRPNRKNPDKEWLQIADLFNSYLGEPDSGMILRLFDFLRGFAIDDEFVSIFRRRLLPTLYTGPARNRLEAVRLGSFHVLSVSTLMNLLAKDGKATRLDVNMSTHEKLSLVHSAAIALAIRFADEVLPYKRVFCQPRVYHGSCSRFVTDVASVADFEDLHTIETVSPWDVHHVPIWRGTPLTSVIGGALCYISPDISFFHWDAVFQGTIRQWVTDLQEAGVDLVKYGTREAMILREHTRGSFDGDAIESSRHQIRDTMPRSGHTPRVQNTRHYPWNETHWVPVRLLDLKFGPHPVDWHLTWAPEFEWMACKFWDLIEKEQVIMPGSWVEA
ncbi:hypothetical protein ACJZ2D_005030 [Fusarium nematophilum]